jgi:hypothetical protein
LLGGDLGVAVAGQVGEQVVLDLVTQIATRERQQRAGVEVRGTQHLRRYQSGLLSSSTTAALNFSAPSGKELRTWLTVELDAMDPETRAANCDGTVDHLITDSTLVGIYKRVDDEDGE